jgi:hypothetical protein
LRITCKAGKTATEIATKVTVCTKTVEWLWRWAVSMNRSVNTRWLLHSDG